MAARASSSIVSRAWPSSRTLPAEATSSGAWPMVSAVLALGWLATALLFWRSVSSGRATRPFTGASGAGAGVGLTPGAAPARSAERRPNERKALREVQAACSAGDADAARRALLEWGEARFPAAPPRSLGALASELSGPVAQEILDLEAQIYGATAGQWDGRALGSALAALDAARSSREASKEDLLPLYR